MLMRTDWGTIFVKKDGFYIKYNKNILKIDKILKIIINFNKINNNYIKLNKLNYRLITEDPLSFPDLSDIFWSYTIINSKIKNYLNSNKTIEFLWTDRNLSSNYDSIIISKLKTIKITTTETNIEFIYTIKDAGLLLFYITDCCSLLKDNFKVEDFYLIISNKKITNIDEIDYRNYRLLTELTKTNKCFLFFPHKILFNYNLKILINNKQLK